MRQHRRAILITGVTAAFAPVAPGQSTNGGGVGGDALNQPGSRAIGRLLGAPRLDPSTPGATRVAVHWRTFLPATETEPTRDYREDLFLFGDFGVSEDTQALDENGSPMTVVIDGQTRKIVFGGAAYRWNPIFGEDRLGFDTYMESDASEQLSELNTFGGLTVNADGDIAFFAGLIVEGEVSDENRKAPPHSVSGESLNLPDLDFLGAKPLPFARGIWSGENGALRRRAQEGLASPQDPDATRAVQGAFFRRLHPSDYAGYAGAGETPLEGSHFAEQRFGQIGAIAMNEAGAIAFRGDIGPNANSPQLGIWADQIVGGSATLHRVFVEDFFGDDPPEKLSVFPFVSTASNNPEELYQILHLGAPVITNEADARVLTYAVVRACTPPQPGAACQFGSNPFATAIIARRPGVDASNPNGFTPQIIAIEGEDFNIMGSPDDFRFVVSTARSGGLPGLADIVQHDSWGQGLPRRQEFKTTTTGRLNFHVYQPRPVVNYAGDVAFLGRLASVNGQAITATEPLSGELLDEGVYTTRGAVNTFEFDRIAFEGDPAPVTVDGAPVPNARFVQFPSGSLQGTQAFSRPIITDSGAVAFIGAWADDSQSPVQVGRSIFISKEPGHLESVVSTGDILVDDLEIGPGVTEDALAGLTFGAVPAPAAAEDPTIDSFHGEHIALTQCGVLMFTVNLVDDMGNDRGWGLFVYNTEEPTVSEGGAPVGPQLVLKTGFGDPGDDMFVIPGVDPMDPPAFLPGNDYYHKGFAVGYGDAVGGDATLHPDGSFTFGVNPDSGDYSGLIVVARQDDQFLDFDLDGVPDGCDCNPAIPDFNTTDSDGDGIPDSCDNCPSTFNPNQADFNGDGVGDACESTGGGGGCTNCLECIEIDCEFNGLLLGSGPDFDQSGLVDDTDLELMMMAMGLTKGRFDMNKDGVVGEKDLAMLLDDYGKAVETK